MQLELRMRAPPPTVMVQASCFRGTSLMCAEWQVELQVRNCL